jgi:tripartite motif-containing protein 71
MSKKNLLFVLEIVLLLMLCASLLSCGSSRAPSSSIPVPTAAPQRLNTGRAGFPLYCPQDLALDQQGNIYLTDSDNGYKGSHRARVLKLSPSGQLLGEWHVFTTFHGDHSGPFGIAVDAQGNNYVADGGDNTIKKLSPTGKLLATWGKAGSAPGELNWPLGVALDSQGNVYVADFLNARVQKFSSTGTLLAILGNTGSSTERLKGPVGIVLDRQGNLYVADVRSHRIAKYSPEGMFLLAWSQAGGKSFSSAPYVALDQQGNLYISDARNRRIAKLSPVGQTLAIVSVKDSVVSLVVNAQGNIYATVGGNLQKLSPTGQILAQWPGTCLP